MILGKIRIQNFKSIKDTAWIHLLKGDLITILAGQNESGKTSLLRALKFFQEGAYDTFEEEDRRMDDFPKVDCVFFLTKAEHQALLKATNKKVADYFMLNGFHFLRGNIEEDNFDLRWFQPAEQKVVVEEYNKMVVEENEEEEESPNEFDAFEYFQEIKPEMVFYSSFGDSILPGKVTHTEVLTNQAVMDFEEIYNVDFQDLMTTATDQKRERAQERIRKEAADSLNHYWNQQISGEEVKYAFTISIHPQKATPTTSYVNFYINQGDEAQLSVSQKSQGFQWFMGFNLRLRAHETKLKNNGLILLIDEPGQGLHEIAQTDVKDVLEELARESGIQIIYSTHQPTLLGKENVNFARLLLVDRTNQAGSTFKSVSQLVSSCGSLDALSPVRTALGMISLRGPLSSDKITIAAEGITEYFYLKTLFEENYIIIPSAGVDQLPNIFGILYGWGIPTKVLVDDDTQGRKAFNKIKKSFFNDEESELFKQKVLKPLGKKGIEDFLSEEVITTILADYGKEYLKTEDNVTNVEQVGKFIFAKSFYDRYGGGRNNLDAETTEQFNEIRNFLENN